MATYIKIHLIGQSRIKPNSFDKVHGYAHASRSKRVIVKSFECLTVVIALSSARCNHSALILRRQSLISNRLLTRCEEKVIDDK